MLPSDPTNGKDGATPYLYRLSREFHSHFLMTARKAKERAARVGARAKANEKEKARGKVTPQSTPVMAK